MVDPETDDVEDGEEDGLLASINIVPFVDIVLVLLIVFMVTSTAIVKASLKVSLPQAASGGAAVDSTVNIVVGKDGSLFLDGQPVTIEELGASIKREAERDPKTRAVIAADKEVSYGKVVRVIDVSKTNGVTAFALNVERQHP